MSERDLDPMPEDWQRALVVVAHPDDIEYGGAAAIAHWTQQGREITYLLATRGEAGIDSLAPEESAPVREAEQRASAAVVGVRTVEFLDHQDGVIQEGPKLRRDIAAAIRRHRPELLITFNHHDAFSTGRWNSPDHRAVGRAALDAAGDAGNRWIFPELLTEHNLEPWGGIRWMAAAVSPYPTHAVAVGNADAERAIASLAAHSAYIRALHEDPKTYAREVVGRVLEMTTDRFGGRPSVSFQLMPR